MIIQARAAALFLRKTQIAVADLIGLFQQIQRILHRLPARIRSEILCLILSPCPREKHPRKRLLHRHPDVRIMLVVLEHRIVLRPVLFNQVALQHQRFHFGIHDNIFKPRHL